MAWKALFLLIDVGDSDVPLTPTQLSDFNSDIVKSLIKIYSMESFIVYRLNETSYKKDPILLPYYGPYAAALSQIIGSSKFEQEIPLYRGISINMDKFQEMDFKPGK